MAENSPKSRVQIARELGCSDNAIRHWIKKYGTPEPPLLSSPQSASAEELAQENERLRRELADVTEQREILKKAAAILGR